MFIVDKEKCIACKQCINDCPVNDIILKDNKAHVKNESCIKYGHVLQYVQLKQFLQTIMIWMMLLNTTRKVLQLMLIIY